MQYQWYPGHMSKAKRQIQESLEEQVIFEIQGRRGAGKTSFCKRIADKCGYRLCVLHLAAFLERPRQQRNDLIHEILLFGKDIKVFLNKYYHI